MTHSYIFKVHKFKLGLFKVTNFRYIEKSFFILIKQKHINKQTKMSKNSLKPSRHIKSINENK